ncbi:DNA repair protein RecO [Candidatus Saccharibacteria bacterium 32-49-12]|nr:MAG: DNA repair protein RecO [Candidatus Saccharibacteria bacterium 32-49-12]
MANSERLRAIVLRRTDYAEADRVLQLLTPKGRRSVIAKGVRRERSKLAGGIELFALCDVVVRSGRGELGLLTSSRLVAFYRHILEDYDRMQFAYSAMKLVARASETIDEPEWFSVLATVLEHLDQPGVHRQLIETWFYFHYSELLGDEVNLRVDVTGANLGADKRYMYDESEKALRPSEQGNIVADHIKLMRLISAKPLEQVAQIGGIDSVIADCWLIARQHSAV